MAAHPLAHINALLNAMATVLLVVGYVHIRQRRERAHRRTMLAAFATSVLFLACYVAYHFGVLGATTTHFTGEGPIRWLYFAILASHVLLATWVPVLALATIWFGLRSMPDSWPLRPLPDDNRMAARRSHRRIARWTFPIWLYVSVTGVLVYVMLYYVYPAGTEVSLLETNRMRALSENLSFNPQPKAQAGATIGLPTPRHACAFGYGLNDLGCGASRVKL